MKRQHKEIHTRVEAFRKLADSFQRATDLQQCVWDLQEQGKALAGLMTAHLEAEETKYATLK